MAGGENLRQLWKKTATCTATRSARYVRHPESENVAKDAASPSLRPREVPPDRARGATWNMTVKRLQAG